jgi:rSAM/selenodomain-associated transferase 1
VLVFAKAPVPGRVKTRLIPSLGEAGAARLAGRMLDHALGEALAAGVGPVELCASPAFDHADWAGRVLPDGVAASDQGTGDLGARMARAAQRSLRARRPVLLMGTDCPRLTARHLRAAAAALRDHEAALIPARDGGYVLLGLRAFHPCLFRHVPWGTAGVARLTRARMAALGWRIWAGPRLADIDRPRDLGRLPDSLRPDLRLGASFGRRLNESPPLSAPAPVIYHGLVSKRVE